MFPYNQKPGGELVLAQNCFCLLMKNFYFIFILQKYLLIATDY